MFGHAVLLFQLPAYLLSRNGDATALMLPMVLGPAQIAGRLAWEAAQSRVPVETAGLALFVFMLLPPLILLGDSGESTVLAVLVLQGAGYGVHTILRPVLAARWLAAIGIASRERIAGSTPTELLGALETAIKESDDSGWLEKNLQPSVSELAVWIRCARSASTEEAA